MATVVLHTSDLAWSEGIAALLRAADVSAVAHDAPDALPDALAAECLVVVADSGSREAVEEALEEVDEPRPAAMLLTDEEDGEVPDGFDRLDASDAPEVQAAAIALVLGREASARSTQHRLDTAELRVRRYSALQGVTGRMSSTLVLSEALQVCVDGVRDALGLSAVAAVLAEGTGEATKIVAESPPGAERQGTLDKALQCLQRASSPTTGPPAFYCIWPAEGVAAIPILVDNRSVGSILVIADPDDPHARAPSPEELVGILSEFAPHVGNAVRNAHLYTDVQVRTAQMSALYSVGRTISAVHELQALLDTIVESAATITGARRCSLMILDEAEGVLRIRAARGVPEWIQNSGVARLGEGVAGYVAEVGEPLLISDIRLDPRFDPRIESVYYDSHSLLSVPLIIHGTPHGVLNMNDKVSGRPFTQSDMELAVLLASQAAVAIDNAYLYEQLRTLAATDSLTRLYNHRHFMTHLDSAMKQARRHNRALSVLMLDLDHFKRVNDTYGHQQGDRVLQAFAAVMRRTARDEDVLARYGGEEFAAILPETDLVGASRLAERIRNRVAELRFRHGSNVVQVTVSVGASHISDDVRSAEELADYADQALYQAKTAGRNRVMARLADGRFVSAEELTRADDRRARPSAG